MAEPLEIVAVPAFADNYLWLVHDQVSGETAVVDPGDPSPVLAEAERRGWRINKILNTHWHPDHTGGNLAIKEATGAAVIGPAGENGQVPGLDIELREGDKLFVSVTLPNIIAGTVGGGTNLPTRAAGLNILGLKGAGKARVFAEVCAATCLAGELSIIGALCAHEFASAHQRLARGKT